MVPTLLPPGTVIVEIFEKKIAGGTPLDPSETVTAGVFNLLVEPGITYQKLFQVKDENGVAIDLTGYDTIRSELRDKYLQDSGVVIAQTVTSYDNQVLGKIDFKIVATETTKLTEQQGVWDLEIQNLDSPPTVLRILEGCWVRLTPQVTD